MADDNISAQSATKPTTKRPKPQIVELEFLRECLIYDADTGILTWLPRPRDHFQNDHAHVTWNKRFAGKPAGGGDGRGHLCIGLTFDGKTKRLKTHRVAWALQTGAWPKDEIDHRDGRRSNNRWNNLREATRSENCHNVGALKSNTSGLPGVSWSRREKCWRAQISLNGKRIFLGRFSSRDLAFRAYLNAKRKLHSFQPAPRPQ